MDDNKNFSAYTQLTTQELYKKLETSPDGLSTEQSKKNYALYGPNRLKENSTSWVTILFNQFNNPFIYILLIIAIVYLFTQQTTEGLIILFIIFINSVIGFYQEYQSDQAMKLLQQYLTTTTTVKRANKIDAIENHGLVPGDIILLTTGDIIPADCRFIESDNLMVNEASLSGESLPIKKFHNAIQTPISSINDAHNIGFSGTIITDGHATAVVFATGKNSTLGAIATLAEQTDNKSALAQGTAQLARAVLFLTFLSLIIILCINIAFKQEQTTFLNMLFFSAALAITAIPTALPIVITFCLTKGATTLQKHKIIVKRLSVIEDFGGIEILCTDKTGTLTENSLTIKNIYSDNKEQAVLYAALSSDILMNPHKNLPQGFDLAIEQKLTDDNKKLLQYYTTISSLPFNYERHRSISLIKKDTVHTLITKGSAEYVIEQCSFLTQEQLTEINKWIKNSELQGERVLAIATKKINAYVGESDTIEKYDQNYESIELLSFCDPIKKTTESALKKAQALNLQIKILSGDSLYVCYSIAQQLGLENNIDSIVLGADFEKSTDEQKKILAYNRTIFARVTPQQKYEIITILQNDYSVGYIGDGINDAPSLKVANVGIAVKEATSVAREAAEIILLQKSLYNIVLGIEEGRKIIINTLKYIKITISSNVGTFYSLAISSLFINYLPMLPLQLLFLDLITDFPLISISTDTVNKEELQKPLHYNIKDISTAIFLFGFICLPFDFMIFKFFNMEQKTLQTCWFLESALKQFILIFSLRTKIPFWKAPLPSLPLVCLCLLAITTVLVLPFTKIGQTLFLFTTPTIPDIMLIFSIVIGYFLTTEIVKITYYRWKEKKM